MIRIDGRTGEGGGQILRSALTLSAVTGQAFTIDHIRAGRSRPGLMRQHLTCVKTAAEVCGARVEGAEAGSTKVVFRPGEIRSGKYVAEIGTAGGTGLVFQTLLPILLMADAESSLVIRGGTHAKAAPPFDFLKSCFLPAIAGSGVDVTLELGSPGFYPAGGGEIRAQICPSDLDTRLTLLDRGELRRVRILAAVSNLSKKIAEREVKAFRAEIGIEDGDVAIESWVSPGPGNVVLAFADFEHHTEVFSAFGEYGVKAETVGRRLGIVVRDYLNSSALAGEHLADQLLLPMALGLGGTFTAEVLSEHFRTNAETIRAFLDVEFETELLPDGAHRVCVA